MGWGRTIYRALGAVRLATTTLLAVVAPISELLVGSRVTDITTEPRVD